MAVTWTMADVDGQLMRVIPAKHLIGRLHTGPIRPEVVWEVLDMQRAFTERETRVLNCLANHLQWNTNRVVDRHGQYLAAPHFVDLVPMDRSNLHKALRSLRTKNAIIRVETGIPYWVVNPDLYYKGHVPESVKKLFRDTVAELRHNDGKPYYDLNRHALTIMRPVNTNT